MNRFTSKHVEPGHDAKNNSHYHRTDYYDDPDFQDELDEYSSDYAYDPDDYNRYVDDDIE